MPLIDRMLENIHDYDPINRSPVKEAWWINAQVGETNIYSKGKPKAESQDQVLKKDESRSMDTADQTQTTRSSAATARKLLL